MKKNYILLLMLLLSFGLLNAQNSNNNLREDNIIHEENFNNWEAKTWKTVNGDDTHGWKSSFKGTDFTECAFHSSYIDITNDWLISPKITITPGTVIKFKEKNKNMDANPNSTYHGLWISEGSDNTLSNGDFKEKTKLMDFADVWTERTIDLSEYAGKSIHIAFKYFGLNASSWYIDDIQVIGTAASDLSIDGRLVYPPFSGGNNKITVAVNSAYTEDLSDVPVTVTHGEFTATKNVTVTANAQTIVEFEGYTVAEEEGDITATITYEADENQDNNEAKIKVLPIKNPAFGYISFSKAGLTKAPMAFDLDNPSTLYPYGEENYTEKIYASVFVNDEWVVATCEKDETLDITAPKNICKVDKYTGVYTVIASTDVKFRALSFNPADNTIYGYGFEYDGKEAGPQTLYKLDPQTGATTKIKDNVALNLSTFAINNEGVAFAINNEGATAKLCTIDLTDFTIEEEIDYVKYVPSGYQSMAFHPENGTLYWAAYYKFLGENQGMLRRIDTETADTYLVAEYTGERARIYGLTFPIIEKPVVVEEGLKEGFENWVPKGWKTYNAEGSAGFIQGNIAPQEGAFFTIHQNEENDCNDWLVSPKFRVPEKGVLEFYQNNRYMTDKNFVAHDVFVSEGSGNPADNEFVLLESLDEEQNFWTKIQINLDKYAGKEVYIGFNYKGTFASVWEMDNLRVFTWADKDVALISDNIPNYAFSGKKFKPSIKVENSGKDDYSGIEVKFIANGEEQSKTIDLKSGKNTKVEFDEMTITENQTIEVKVTAEGDEVTSNNNLTTFIKVTAPTKAFGYCTKSVNDKVKKGLVSFMSDKTSEVTAVNKFSGSIQAGTMINDLLFSVMKSESNLRENRFVITDTETGKIYNISTIPTKLNIVELAYDAKEDLVYALSNEKKGQKLYSIDYRSGITTLVAEAAEEQKTLETIAINKDGNAFAIGSDRILYSVNLEEFTIEFIGAISAIDVKGLQSMAFDRENDVLYWDLNNPIQSELVAIDPASGRTTTLGSIKDQAYLTSLGFTSSNDEVYTVFNIRDDSDSNLYGISVTVGELTKKTDENGIVAFIGLEKDKSYDYTINYKGKELAKSSFTATKNQTIEKVVEGATEIDIAINKIILPEYGFKGVICNVSAILENKGNAPLKQIKLTVSSGDNSVEFKTDIAINEAKTISFSSLVLAEDGKVTIIAEAADDIDSNNDKLEASTKAINTNKAYGYRIFSTKENIKRGPVTFEAHSADKLRKLPVIGDESIIAWSGTMINNYWFVNYIKETPDGEENTIKTPENFSLIDTETGRALYIADADMKFREMAYDYKNKTLYGIVAKRDKQELYTINYLTGETTFVSDYVEDIHILTFAINKEGEAFVIGHDECLYKVNLETFSLTKIGSTKVSEALYNQSMAFDHENGILYWARSNAEAGDLHIVDTETGKATLLSPIGYNAEVTALGFKYGEGKRYIALHTINGDNENVANVKVSLNSIEKVTDKEGIALYLDIDEGDYPYTYEYKDVTYNHSVKADKNKVVDIDITTAVENITANDISIYPNPSNGIVNIKGVKAEKLMVVDLLGNMVKSVNPESHTINMNDLSEGVYTIRIYTESQILNKKIVLKK
ncbi:MAG: choice-of-anchor J domain-containing protein [Hyphomicrobiales bacterium]